MNRSLIDVLLRHPDVIALVLIAMAILSRSHPGCLLAIAGVV